ncbi:MAG: bifunctional phosphoribosylaminoimidazolecarboxamide formyltransferase/IMP cyclohydrolase [Anaerococcus sp.]|uniref:Bifunctional purine biosynthesis protein PurH n=1 Tax=Anaerococcus nagyae TaxID=1755241 RepID=A0A3E2TK17_9FIRM|nr:MULTISPECIES: bifunctional phosphoribosylaminoimidazolecarboxamide formyltransferase/IMP cyclohydrolase [Anaerococcus]MBP2069456.1 phosphoribosylaminoimidazolecarboxamide formyltransferase/IMP cyclohydrolase [Anaerococcus nagyae]MDU2354299.1 bifunctional phosphoribosylaminoimidazolecarboxamide formyltransferase/IMP cyclohydrolase [Anaerococcus sp.]MDU2565771.1 bifunctional phosphoribosylaminoimidazolecarboxamide formyltransferase/IMP cyclohydrolase [Anaerococcus sp.]MDU3211519.1 bifunctional
MRALISVTDKTGIEELAKGLKDLGVEIVSTGGTYKKINDAGIEAIEIDQITNFPEILEGRVKTLSPYVHGGILYKRDDENHVNTVKEHNIKPIDIVVVNLYEFQKALEKGNPDNIIENIDIGGPSMVRSAAKNHKDVLIVTDPADYDELLERLKNDEIDLLYRQKLAMKAYNLTAFYDSIIARYFSKLIGEEGKYKTYGFEKESDLRYGENPGQEAALYNDPFVKGLMENIEVIHGKEMSYNNYNDLNPALELAQELGEKAVVALKHQSPCGVAVGSDIYDSYTKAFECDSQSIFGGIVAVNGIVDGKTASKMHEIFLEIIAASDFTDEALEILTQKKNVRLVRVNFDNETVKEEIRYLNGKVLIQGKDFGKDEVEIVTNKKPNEAEIKDLLFAQKVVKYVKSNAIVVAKDMKTLGCGAGQQSRVWALESIRDHFKDRDFTGAVLGSDAFFPFSDTVELAHEMGISSIIEPGGSIRDKDSIDKCNEYNMSMVFSKSRHFKH